MRYLFVLLIIGSIVGCQPNSTNQVDTEDGLQRTPLDTLNELIRSEKSAINYLARANYYLNTRDLRSAQIDIDSAYILDSKNTDVLLSRGNVYYFLNQSRYSRDSWEACVAVDPDHLECRMKLAELYFVVRNYSSAMIQLNAILDKDGRDPLALYMKGNVYRDMGDTSQAILFVQQAVDVDPQYFDALDFLGVIYAQKNSLIALDYYNRALEIQPDNADLYYKIGLFHQNRVSYNLAIENYTTSIQFDPKQKFAYFNLGYIHIELQVYSKGIEYFTGAINSDEMYFQAFYGRAYCYELLGDVQRAKLDYQTALNINMEYDPAKVGLGRVTNILEME